MKRAVVLIVLLLLGACQPGTVAEQPRQEFRIGSEGLRLQFLPNLPPARLFDDILFDVALEVSNVGASDVGFANDRIYLSGFDPNILTGISTFGEALPFLEGKNAFNPIGSLDYTNFQGNILPLGPRNINTYPFSLFATACYEYQTIASKNVCIDPDPFSTTQRQKVCVPSAVGFGTQGAPIAVTNVNVEPSSRVTRFEITIQNVGSGQVFKAGPGFLNKCSPYDPEGLRFDEIDAVRLDRVEVAGQSILGSCRPKDRDGQHVRLINGRGVVFCDLQNPPGNTAFVTPLIVELTYGYRQTLSQQITILSSE